MILLDFNSLFYYRMLGLSKTDLDNINIPRNIILSDIMYYIRRFSNEYGDLVVCTDSKNNWRRDTFPQYKRNRKKSRDEDPEKWNRIFEISDILWNEFIDNLPYKFIGVDRCEGDDVVAVLAQNIPGKNLIISTDKDFKQLLNSNIHQYMFSQNKFISPEKDYIIAHILKGDASDGIPNIYSDDDFYTLENRPRQKSIKKQLIESFNINDLSQFEDNIVKNIKRNRLMIDLSQIPDEISASIYKTYMDTKVAPGYKLRKYLFKHQLKNIIKEGF